MSVLSDNALSQITDLARHIEATNQTVEPGFMQICESLQNLSLAIGKIRENTFINADGMDPAREDHPVRKVLELVEQALVELNRSQQDAHEDMTILEQTAQITDRLEQSRGTLGKMTRRLRIIGLNMQVESVHLDWARADFTDFSYEISKLSDRIKEISATYNTDIQSCHQLQMATIKTMRSELAYLAPLVEEVDMQIRQVLIDIATLSEHSHQTMTQAVHIFAEVTRHINDVVMGIQFHDITRQQLEHVIESLDEIRIGYTDSTAGNESSQLGMTYLILTLQGAQIEQAAQTFRRVYDEMDHALIDIASSILKLNNNPAENPTSDRQVYPQIQSKLANFSSLLRKTSQLRHNIIQSITRLSGLSEKLHSQADAIGEIRIELDLKSMNAIVLSGHLGQEGRTQEVLAQEVYQTSNDTGAWVDSISRQLKDIVDNTQKILRKVNSAETNNQVAKEPQETLLDRYLNEFNQVFDNSSVMLDQLQQSILELNDRIEPIRDSLAFLTDLEARLREHSLVLNELAAPLADYAGSVTESQRAELEQIGRRYTMENERIIHRLCLTGANNATSDTGAGFSTDTLPQADLSSGSEDDLGDNIELF